MRGALVRVALRRHGRRNMRGRLLMRRRRLGLLGCLGGMLCERLTALHHRGVDGLGGLHVRNFRHRSILHRKSARPVFVQHDLVDVLKAGLFGRRR